MRISLTAPRRQRLRAYHRLREQRAGRTFAKVVNYTLFQETKPWFAIKPSR